MTVYWVSGAAGFIGSALCRALIGQNNAKVIGFDSYSYAGSRVNVESIKSANFTMVEGNIGERTSVECSLQEYQPDIIFHLAAETHVDRSIVAPDVFIETNIVGTFNLLQCAKQYYQSLPDARNAEFRFIHVSTDEVFGSLSAEASPFLEQSTYAPSSPYSASKACADHLVSAWGKTYGLPVIQTHCSNNYGVRQYPEKLIPFMILSALSEESLTVYGAGTHVRDWLHVDDHVEALRLVSTHGVVGESYNIGAGCEHTNIDIVQMICAVMDELKPRNSGSYAQLITYVDDRAGHDQRYAIDAGKIKTELGWSAQCSFSRGLKETIQWYIKNEQQYRNNSC